MTRTDPATVGARHAVRAAELDVTRGSTGALVLALAGDWTIDDGLVPLARVQAELGGPEPPGRVLLDTTRLGRWDTALVVFVERIAALCAERGVALDLAGLPEGLRNLVGLARAVPERAGTRKGGGDEPFVTAIGRAALRLFEEGGQQVAFLGEVGIALGRLLHGRAVLRGQDLIAFMRAAGPQAFGIVAIINLLMGMILAFIGAVQLQKFGAGIYVANLVGIAVVREMAAVMTGIVLAGRTGAAFAAQLGTMQAQEEIDALTTFGIPPVEFLVLPRALALALMMPLLYLYAAVIGVLGGFIIATGMLDLTPALYLEQTLGALDIAQVLIGLSKSVVFGILVAVAGCLRGMQASRSAAGVGDAATGAVVTGILHIIITDAVFAVVLNVLGI